MELKRIDRRRRCISARRRAHLVKRFQSSGLTRRAFARRYGLGFSTLGKWLMEARAASPRPSPVVFREVSLAGVATGAEKDKIDRPAQVKPKAKHASLWVKNLHLRQGPPLWAVLKHESGKGPARPEGR